MKIDSIKTYQTPNFKAGKVRVFSDFDKTFMPASHGDFARNYDSDFVNFIRENFKQFKDFLGRTRDGLKFTITTGRTFGEFQTMAEISRERKFGMPLPDTLIAKNGSDEYIRIGTDEEFYNGGKYPFSYDVTNKDKEEKIKKLTGWDGNKIKQCLIDIFKSYNLRIVEADSEHGVGDYGYRSLFSAGKLPYEVGKVFVDPDKADWSVGFRKDGNLKLYVLKPADEWTVPERANAFRNMEKNFRHILKERGVKYVYGSADGHLVNGRMPLSFTPEIANPNGGSRELTKAYDTSEAIKDAIKNNDLVIAAGDSSNDLEMVNPFSHLFNSLPEEIRIKYKDTWRAFWCPAPNVAIKILDKNPDLAKAYHDMPFVGIIVKRKDNEDKLSSLFPLAEGKYKKIVIVEEGELQKGIKEAIKLYSEQNPKYAEKLSQDLKNEIHNIKSHPDNEGGGSCPPIRR